MNWKSTKIPMVLFPVLSLIVIVVFIFSPTPDACSSSDASCVVSGNEWTPGFTWNDQMCSFNCQVGTDMLFIETRSSGDPILTIDQQGRVEVGEYIESDLPAVAEAFCRTTNRYYDPEQLALAVLRLTIDGIDVLLDKCKPVVTFIGSDEEPTGPVWMIVDDATNERKK